MPDYDVQFTRRADRQLRALGRVTQKRLSAAIDALRAEPRSRNAKPLVGTDNYWRVRVGAYRVVCSIQDERLIVLVVKLGHRRSVYSDL